MVGCLLDPDPGEGDNQTPPLGDEYWYPLYEKLCALDVPAHVHSTGNQHGRGTYSTHFIDEESLAILSLLNSRVFLDFPKLKIIVSHGGGSVPYQVGRWRAERLHPVMAKNLPLKESFDDSLKRLYYDTVIHSKESIAMLVRLVGSDRVVFGTENPGSGTAMNPETGRAFDDIKALVDDIDFLTAQDRANIYEHNARRLFPRLKAKGGAPAVAVDVSAMLTVEGARKASSF
jgi:predicted TIM-barrel fold metal-dependent hydrolase